MALQRSGTGFFPPSTPLARTPSLSSSSSFEVDSSQRATNAKSSTSTGWSTVAKCVLVAALLGFGIATYINPELVTQYIPQIGKDSLEYWITGDCIGGGAVLLSFLGAYKVGKPLLFPFDLKKEEGLRLILSDHTILNLTLENDNWIDKKHGIQLVEFGGQFYQVINGEKLHPLDLEKVTLDDLLYPRSLILMDGTELHFKLEKGIWIDKEHGIQLVESEGRFYQVINGEKGAHPLNLRKVRLGDLLPVWHHRLADDIVLVFKPKKGHLWECRIDYFTIKLVAHAGKLCDRHGKPIDFSKFTGEKLIQDYGT